MTKKTLGQTNKQRFLDADQIIPICANVGCNNNVVVRDWKYFSFKHHCSNCLSRIQKGLPPREGVIFTKKNYCENKNSILGFRCPVDPNFPFPNNVLHEDHIDGNHYNNTPENLMTLCSICHAIKGLQSGDFISTLRGRNLNF